MQRRHAACPCSMDMEHGMDHVHALCPCCMSMLVVYAACLRCMSLRHILLHVHSAWSCCLSLLHVHVACLCCMSMPHVLAACPCYWMLLSLKGLSHEIFGPVFWAVWMYLGLNVNRLWFLNFYYALLILDNCFKFWRVSGQTFSEILRISEKDWQMRMRFSNFRRFWLAVLQETLLRV
jgi:hypothetical protein